MKQYITISSQLLILKKITDSAGRVFRPFNGDYVLIEGLFSSGSFIRNFPIDFTNFLPVYDCLSPQQSLDIYRTKQTTQLNQTLLEVSHDSIRIIYIKIMLINLVNLALFIKPIVALP